MPESLRNYTQPGLKGGINLYDPPIYLGENEYVYGYNIRTRDSTVGPCYKSVKDIYAPTGKVQALQAYGNILVAVISGIPYYKTIGTNTWYEFVGTCRMSAVADTVYLCAVPNSSLEYLRKSPSGNAAGNVTLGGGATLRSTACLVVQDGVSQPWLLFADGTTRKAGTFDDWNKDTFREYIPIGTLMLHFRSILYILAPDKKTFLRSVSGRPLDFMVQVDTNGDKVVVDDVPSDAYSTSFSVDFNEVTCLYALDVDAFAVGTAYKVMAVNQTFTSAIFNEPQHSKKDLFTAGIVNNFSIVSYLGNHAFIDFEGLKTFNAVYQFQYEGNNDVMSLKIASLFKGIIQDTPCCASWDNYLYFSVKTTLGYVLLVYDMLSTSFVSIDLTEPSIAGIKSLTTSYTPSSQKLYATTRTNEIWELYQDKTATETISLKLKAFTCQAQTKETVNPRQCEHKTDGLRLVFISGNVPGTFYAIEETDGRKNANTVSTNLPALSSGMAFPLLFPLDFSSAYPSIFNAYLSFKKISKVGYAISYILTWTGDTKLLTFEAYTNPDTAEIGKTQKSNAITRTA